MACGTVWTATSKDFEKLVFILWFGILITGIPLSIVFFDGDTRVTCYKFGQEIDGFVIQRSVMTCIFVGFLFILNIGIFAFYFCTCSYSCRSHENESSHENDTPNDLLVNS